MTVVAASSSRGCSVGWLDDKIFKIKFHASGGSRSQLSTINKVFRPIDRTSNDHAKCNPNMRKPDQRACVACVTHACTLIPSVRLWASKKEWMHIAHRTHATVSRIRLLKRENKSCADQVGGSVESDAGRPAVGVASSHLSGARTFGSAAFRWFAQSFVRLVDRSLSCVNMHYHHHHHTASVPPKTRLRPTSGLGTSPRCSSSSTIFLCM